MGSHVKDIAAEGFHEELAVSRQKHNPAVVSQLKFGAPHQLSLASIRFGTNGGES
jgi:hypothetical protein